MTTLLYADVERTLRHRIAAGAFAGGNLPTEAQLCKELGVSRSTVRRALLALRDAGLVVSLQGSGWTVTPTQPDVRLGARLTTDPATATPVLQLVRCEFDTAPAAIRSLLQAGRTRRLLLLERTSVIDETVAHRAETWFAKSVGTQIDHGAAAEVEPARLIANLGWQIGRFDQYAQATLSDTRDEEVIGLSPNTPVLQVTRLCFDTAQVPLFVSVHRHPGASTRIELDLPTSNNPGDRVVSLTPH